MDMLRLKSPRMRSPAVKRLQEFGDLLGFDFGPNDGVFGPVTERVVKALQVRLGLAVDGVCGPKTWAAILREVDLGQTTELEVQPGVVDRRGLHPHPRLYKCRRPPGVVDTILVHQTGCQMPNTAPGWDNLNAHVGTLKVGMVVVENDILDWIWHAQGLSRRSIGHEIEGNFHGVIGRPATLWEGGGGPDTLSPAQVDGALRGIGISMETAREYGCNIKYLNAHRQSYRDRRGDPGEEIWEKIALPAMKLYGLQDGGSDFYVGSGRPIPVEWDARRVHHY